MWPFKKKKKVLPPYEGVLPPVIIVNDEGFVHEILGITEERALQIQNKIMDIIGEKKDTVQSMIEFNKFCKQQNEFAFGMFIFRELIHAAAMKEAIKNVFK